MIRTDPQGDTLWTRRSDTLASGEARDLVVTDLGNIIVTGYSTVSGASNPFLAELDANGDLLWSRIYDQAVAGWSYAMCRTTTGYALFGLDYAYDFILLNVDLNGDLIWMQYFDEDLDYGYSVEQTTDGGFVMTGITGPGGPLSSDIVLIRTDSLGDINTGVDEATVPDALHAVIFPNPAGPHTTLAYTLSTSGRVTIRILDVLGRNVRLLPTNSYRPAGRHSEVLDLSAIASGSYVVELRVASCTTAVRLIKQ